MCKFLQADEYSSRCSTTGLSQVLRSCIEKAGVMIQLPWHLYHTAMTFYSMIGGHPDHPQLVPIATHADGHRGACPGKRS